MMSTEIPQALVQTLLDIDGRGYKAYKVLQGKTFSFPPFTVRFEHVQGDPFAQPSRISVAVDMSVAGFEENLYDTPVRRLAFEDHLLRVLDANIKLDKTKIGGTGKSGEVFVQSPGQKVIKRNALLVRERTMQVVMFAGLPAGGRTILGKECVRLFTEVLPPVWAGSLLASSIDLTRLRKSIEVLEDYVALQGELEGNGWVSFIADGSLLPRLSGISDRPLEKAGIPFKAPEKLSAEVNLPHKGKVRGMPIPKGITLIVGGGFHGKSTLLRAVQDAVYPHTPGDGRETIATVRTAAKVRAEDGRSVKNVNVSGFMENLPLVESTQSFSTPFASGSTSQAVNILEAVESGANLLLMDEDTCATNFMIRDARMQALIESKMEPITPFLDRVEEIYNDHGVSVILVMGGSGDYFDCAHHVIAMETFAPRLVTEEAREIIRKNPGGRKKETAFPFPAIQKRRIELKNLNFRRGKKECVIQARGLDTLIVGRTEVDVRYLEQLVEGGQLEMCGWILSRLQTVLGKGLLSNIEGLKQLYEEIEQNQFDAFTPYNTGLLALPRIQEVMAVLNRIR